MCKKAGAFVRLYREVLNANAYPSDYREPHPAHTTSRACEEYCRRQGYEVIERFHEEGESAKTTDRSQLQRLLTYCRLNKGRVHPSSSCST